MERLTARSPKNNMAYLVNVKQNEQDVESPYPNTLRCILDSFSRLADYEETGLMPDEILTGKGLAEAACALIELKHYKEAEAEGRLVVLPCKVGTRVWVIGQNCDLCRDMYAEEPCLFGSCEYKEVFESVFGYGMIDNFGKTVFMTRETAEKALGGSEG